jgi:hypothetical protein
VSLMEGWEFFAQDSMTAALAHCWAAEQLELSIIGRCSVWFLSLP